MYTYFYTRFGKIDSRNFEYLEDAIKSAILDYEWISATPREIKSGDQIILNQDQIIQKWREYYYKYPDILSIEKEGVKYVRKSGRI